MFDFLNALEPLNRGFWYVALGASFFFIIQTIFTFIGADSSDTDFDSEHATSDSPFQLFSLRNLINFLLGFGWSGVAFYQIIDNKIVITLLAIIFGVIFVLLFLFLIKQILKFTEDNTFRPEYLIGKIGEVYLKIPANKSGKGKVLVSYKGTSHELQAITNENETINSSEAIRVVAIEDQILIVTKI